MSTIIIDLHLKTSCFLVDCDIELQLIPPVWKPKSFCFKSSHTYRNPWIPTIGVATKSASSIRLPDQLFVRRRSLHDGLILVICQFHVIYYCLNHVRVCRRKCSKAEQQREAGFARRGCRWQGTAVTLSLHKDQ